MHHHLHIGVHPHRRLGLFFGHGTQRRSATPL
jgi:hypothetical protein